MYNYIYIYYNICLKIYIVFYSGGLTFKWARRGGGYTAVMALSCFGTLDGKWRKHLDLVIWGDIFLGNFDGYGWRNL